MALQVLPEQLARVLQLLGVEALLDLEQTQSQPPGIDAGRCGAVLSMLL